MPGVQGGWHTTATSTLVIHLLRAVEATLWDVIAACAHMTTGRATDEVGVVHGVDPTTLHHALILLAVVLWVLLLTSELVQFGVVMV